MKNTNTHLSMRSKDILGTNFDVFCITNLKVQIRF